MSIPLQELHAAAVHFPVAMLPIAVGADMLGHATDNEQLLSVGRLGIGAAAVGAAASAVTGLIAQEEVNVEGRTMDMLITHRNLNLAATMVAGLMAGWRTGRERPTVPYLALGLAGVGILTYTAYLGGTLVYKHGVGVAPAGGQYREDAPELGNTGQSRAFVSDAASDVATATKHLAQELAEGRIAPSLGIGRSEASSTTNASATEDSGSSAGA